MGRFICVLSTISLIRHASNYAKETTTKSFQKSYFKEHKATETNLNDGKFNDFLWFIIIIIINIIIIIIYRRWQHLFPAKLFEEEDGEEKVNCEK